MIEHTGRRALLAGAAAGVAGLAFIASNDRPAAAATSRADRLNHRWINVREVPEDLGLASAVGEGVDGKPVDDTDALKKLMEWASANTAALVFPPGRYRVTELEVLERVRLIGVASGMTQFPTGGVAHHGVVILPFDESAPSDEPLVTLKGHGASIEDITIDGIGRPKRTGLAVRSFEGRLNRVRVQRFDGIGIHVQQLNNVAWRDVYVDRCGTPTTAAMVIESHKNDKGEYAGTNFCVFDALTVAHCPNTAIDIAWGTAPYVHYASNLTFIGLHVESAKDAGSWAPEAQINRDGLLRIGNVRQVTFLSSVVLGAASPLIDCDYRLRTRSSEQDGYPANADGPRAGGGGLQFIGGELIQRPSPAGYEKSTIIRLAATIPEGKTAAAVSAASVNAVKFMWLDVPAIEIKPDFAAGVRLDPSCSVQRSSAAIPIVNDLRERSAQYVSSGAETQMYAFAEQVRFDRQIVAYQDRSAPDFPSNPDSPTKTIVTPPAAWLPKTVGNDIAGNVSVTFDAAQDAGATLARVNFKRPVLTRPTVTVTPTTVGTAALATWVEHDPAGAWFEVRSATPVPRGRYEFSYQVIAIGTPNG